MRYITSLAVSSLFLIMAAAPAAAQPTEQCRPTRPDKPVNSEDNNPGLGRVVGFNEDREDVHPFGRSYTEFFIDELAHNGVPGDSAYLGYVVGNDCKRAEADD